MALGIYFDRTLSYNYITEVNQSHVISQLKIMYVAEFHSRMYIRFLRLLCSLWLEFNCEIIKIC